MRPVGFTQSVTVELQLDEWFPALLNPTHAVLPDQGGQSHVSRLPQVTCGIWDGVNPCSSEVSRRPKVGEHAREIGLVPITGGLSLANVCSVDISAIRVFGLAPRASG